jgi:hypothetical protein
MVSFTLRSLYPRRNSHQFGRVGPTENRRRSHMAKRSQHPLRQTVQNPHVSSPNAYVPRFPRTADILPGVSVFQLVVL